VDHRRIEQFEALYREHLTFVWGAARGFGTPEHTVPDVVQEVFITAYRRLAVLDAEVSPRGWLYAVTRRVVFRIRRTAARTARREAALRRVPEELASPHARGDAAADLERLLGALDEAQREVLVMADLLGMSGPEMASQTGVPLDTVYSRLRLARGRLQRMAAAERVHSAIGHARRPPDDDAARRSWAALVLAVPKSAAVLGGLGLAKFGAIAGATVATIAIGVALVRAPAPAPARAGSDGSAPMADASHQTVLAAQRSGPVAALPEREPEPLSGPQPAAPPRAAAPGGVRSHIAPSPVAPAEPEPRPSVLEAELAALERARGQLDAGDAAAALATLEGTPSVQLADANGALRVRALCELGRVEPARREADRLRAAHPSSHVARSARCDS